MHKTNYFKQISIHDKVVKILTSQLFLLFETIVFIFLFYLHEFLRVPNRFEEQGLRVCTTKIIVLFFFIVLELKLIFIKDFTGSLSTFTSFIILGFCFGRVMPAHELSIFIHILVIGIVVFAVRIIIFIWTSGIKFKKGRLFYPMLLFTIVLTFGGIGVTKPNEYFNAMNIYYTLALGILMLFVYILFVSRTEQGSKESVGLLAKQLINIGVLSMGLVFFAILFSYRNNRTIIYYEDWKCDIATLALFAAPVPFYFAVQDKEKGILYFLLGIFIHCAIILTFARSGMLIGPISLFACMMFACFLTKNKNKNFYIFAVICSIITICAFAILIFPQLAKQAGRFGIREDEPRWKLLKEAKANFLRSPIVGVGFGWRGNAYPAINTNYFFHNTVLELLSSFGIIGLLSYIYLTIYRCILLRRCYKIDKAKTFPVILIYINIELMSLFNLGLFNPIPYTFLFTLILAKIERHLQKEWLEDFSIKKTYLLFFS